MVYSYHPFYKDTIFWTAFAAGWGGVGAVNYIHGYRPFAGLHNSFAVALISGYCFYRISRFAAASNHQAKLGEHLRQELIYNERLGNQQGKFLENREGEIKEVFRTIIF